MEVSLPGKLIHPNHIFLLTLCMLYLFQGSVIILFAITFFNDSYVNIVTITFTALILIELLNVYTQINNMNMQMVFILVATAVTYFMSIILLKSYFETSYMDKVFFMKVGILALLTWAPI